MQTQHLKALKTRHEELERNLRSEQCHAFRDESRIVQLKKEKLLVKEQMAHEETA